MRIVFFGNNRLGWRILRLLRREDVVAYVLHPETKRRYGRELTEGIETEQIIDGSKLSDGAVLAHIRALEPEIAVSAGFGYILRPPLLDVFPSGCVNLHTSLLPYNRGAHPNVWSIVDGTPAGVTLHYMDEGVDTGAVIAQRGVEIDPIDTGETLYHRLEEAAVELFEETWPLLKRGSAGRRAQPTDSGSVHRVADLAKLREIDLDRSYRAEDLINILRACTFPPHPGAYFVRDGTKIQLRLNLSYLPAD